jgi:hypothetical protein
MLNKGTHILPDLKDHEVQPPSFLLDNIMQKIEEEEDTAFKKLFAQLRNHSISPTSDLFKEAIEPEIQLLKANPLKALKDYSIAPPVQFEKMLSGAKETTKAKVISFAGYSRRIAAAVAVIILGGAAYFIYQNTQNSPLQNNNPVAVNVAPANNKSTEPAVAAPQLNPAITPITPQTGNTTIASVNSFGQFNKPEAPSSATGSFAPTFSIDGNKFAVKDNDYLATFASFTEESAPAFLRAEKPVATAITVDKYTSISISEGMAAILKKTYKTRKNGKPTRRARKQKEKIEKWKQADADYFNQNSTNNPLDPMDLGDFILYK